MLSSHVIYIQFGGHAYKISPKAKIGRRLESRPLAGFHCTRYPTDCNPFTTRLSGRQREALRGLQVLNSVSRDFYQDTALLPYQWNTWAFQSVHVMRRFVEDKNRLPQASLRAIQSVFGQNWMTKESWMTKWKGINLDYTRFFPGLKILCIDGPGEVTKHDLVEGTKEMQAKSTLDIDWQMIHGNPPYDFL